MAAASLSVEVDPASGEGGGAANFDDPVDARFTPSVRGFGLRYLTLYLTGSLEKLEESHSHPDACSPPQRRSLMRTGKRTWQEAPVSQ